MNKATKELQKKFNKILGEYYIALLSEYIKRGINRKKIQIEMSKNKEMLSTGKVK